MFAVPHIISTKGDNKSSCRSYATYLLKDNDFFFNHTSDTIDLEEGISLIDENSKRRLTENDAKWYAPVYALSEEESQYVAYYLFKKEVENFSDLSDEEQKIFNKYIASMGKEFQNEMAKNFNKEELNIRNGRDLFYIGVVENKRTFTQFDEEVIAGLKKNGEEKKGFNTHIHIIQSRLANNEKYSKISPMANEKKSRVNNIGKVGFDRTNFANRIEHRFDVINNYVRHITDSFEYKNRKSKGEDPSQFEIIDPDDLLKNKLILSSDKEKNKEKKLKTDFRNRKPKDRDFSKLNEKEKADARLQLNIIKEKRIQQREKPVSRKKYIPKSEADRIIAQGNLLSYFEYLEKIGLVKKQYEKGKDIFYKNLRDELIAVNENGYVNYNQRRGGKYIKAVQDFQNLNWLDALNKIIELQKETIELPEIKKKKSFELLSENQYPRSIYEKPYENIGISGLFTDKYLTGISYQVKDKEYRALGFKNESGGYYTYNDKFNSFTKVGEGDISIIKGSDETLSKDVVIFSNYVEYMAYMQLHNISNLKETVIILNDRENTEKLLKHLGKQNGKIYSFADNFTIDKIEEQGREVQDLRASHKVDKSTFLERLQESKNPNIQEDIEEEAEEQSRKKFNKL